MYWTVIVFAGDQQPPLDYQHLWKPSSSGDEVRQRISAAWEPVAMGTSADIRERISAHLPGVQWLAPACGLHGREGLTVQFDLGFEESVTWFAVQVEGHGAALADLLPWAVPNRWHLLDGWTGRFLDPGAPSDAGWVACQAYWDEVRRFFDAVVPLPGQLPLF